MIEFIKYQNIKYIGKFWFWDASQPEKLRNKNTFLVNQSLAGNNFTFTKLDL